MSMQKDVYSMAIVTIKSKKDDDDDDRNINTHG